MHIHHMVGTHTLHDGKFCSIAYLIAVKRYNPVKGRLPHTVYHVDVLIFDAMYQFNDMVL